MEYYIKKRLLLLLILSFLISCGENLKYKIKDKAVKNNEVLTVLEGEFLTTENVPENLKNFIHRPLVLMFADSFCIECVKEVKEIKKTFKKLLPPKNINFLSLVIGEGLEEGIYWQEVHEVPWAVGEDEDLSLFSKYCPELQTPCTVIFNPDFGIVFKKTGRVSIELIQSYLGEW